MQYKHIFEKGIILLDYIMSKENSDGSFKIPKNIIGSQCELTILTSEELLLYPMNPIRPPFTNGSLNIIDWKIQSIEFTKKHEAGMIYLLSYIPSITEMKWGNSSSNARFRISIDGVHKYDITFTFPLYGERINSDENLLGFRLNVSTRINDKNVFICDHTSFRKYISDIYPIK